MEPMTPCREHVDSIRGTGRPSIWDTDSPKRSTKGSPRGSTHMRDTAAEKERDIRDAKEGCRMCPLLDPCFDALMVLMATLPRGDIGGVIAGTSTADRARMGAPTRRAKDNACGTPKGYVRHGRAHEPACEPCKEAHRVYRRELHAQRAKETSA